MAETITADEDFRLYDFKIAGYEQETVNRRRIILQMRVNHAGVHMGSNGLSLQEIRGNVKPLLMGPNYFSFGMIGEFADAEPETVRQMFRDLYDESTELAWRFDNFKKQSIKLLSIIGKADKNHYQDEHTISIYLWLRYPAKYYIYKFTETQNMAELLKSQYRFVSGRYVEILANWLPLYDEVAEHLSHEEALIQKVKG